MDKALIDPLGVVIEKHILLALQYNYWNRTTAAEVLGISVRGLGMHISRMKQKGIYIPESKHRRKRKRRYQSCDAE